LYVPGDQWSKPEAGEQPPCFRQGDLVRITWAQVKLDPATKTGRGIKVDLRTEIVALVSADCDLVDRNPPKRKGVLVSPLRDVPKNIARDQQMMAVLKAATVTPEGDTKIPVNLFYFESVDEPGAGPTGDRVVHLEHLSMVGFGDLTVGTKIAELTEEKRQDFRERVKYHFSRDEKADQLSEPAPAPP
jgi:hypothetical protein